MPRFADPLHCPDCRAVLRYGAEDCPGCGLRVRGALGERLLRTLGEADAILARMRAESPTAPPPPVEAAVPPPTGLTDGLTPLPPSPSTAGPLRAGIAVASVPRVLLGLGAACLLVAALVFLAVTWSALGVGGRTAVLLVATALAGAVAGWAAARTLRATVEAVGLVALGLVALDLAGAWSAGWFGGLSGAGLAAGGGLALVLVAGGAVLAVGSTPTRRFVAGEVVVAVATAVTAAGLAGGGWATLEVRLVAAVAVAAGVAVGAVALRAPVSAVGTGLVTVASWAVLVLAGLDRLGGAPTFRSVWLEADGWPLLAAAVLAALPALASRRVPGAARAGCLGAALLVLTAVLVAPAADESATTRTAVVAGLTLAAAAATGARRPWGVAAAAPMAAGLAWTAAATAGLAALSVERLATLAQDPWSGSPGGRLPGVDAPDLPAAWLLPVAVGTGLAAAVATGRLLLGEGATSGAAARTGRGPLLAAVLAAGTLLGTATLALYPVPVWALLVAPLTATVVLAARAGRPGEHPATAVAETAAWLSVLLCSVPAALYDARLSLAVAATGAATAGWLLGRCAPSLAAAAAGTVASWSGAGLAWTVAALAGLAVPSRATAALVLLAGTVVVLTVARDRLPGRLAGVAGAEVAAATAAVVVATAGADAADRPAPWLAGYLTLAGAAVCAVAVLRTDRRWAGWVGGLLFAAASWVWLADRAVTAPEPYALPSAVALVALGLCRLRGAPGSRTGPALAPGLALGLGPSLVWSMADPESLRTALLGAVCLVLVLVGARLRWAAPLVAGATAGALLVARLAAPYLMVGVPRWLLLGAAGAVLVALGVTWEQRLRDTRTAVAHLRALR